MNDLPLWSCEFFALKEQGGVALDSLSVGSKFGWKCHGDLAVNWEQQTVPHLAFDKPEHQYSLLILKVVRQDPNDVQYVVTSYKAGEHAPGYIRVLQGSAGAGGEKGFEANGLKWQVRSVLDPKQQPPQAYGSFGPWHLSLPLWFTATILLGILLLVYALVRKVRRYLQRRRMLEDLKRHQTALPPLHQFYRDARGLRRRMHAAKDASELKVISVDLDREFRLFVLRQFQIPALDWSDRAILDDLRKRHRKIYREGAEMLKRTLRELTKLKARPQVEMNDIEQMHRMSLDAAERLFSEGGGRA